MKAMILAAGFGTRLRPMTDIIPKPLIPYKKKPMICYQIENLIKCGVDEIIINIHHLPHLMETFFKEKNFGIPIRLIYEKEILGTGGGILNAKEFLRNSEYSIVVNTDIISNFDLNKIISAHRTSYRDVTLLIQKRITKKYLAFDKELNFHGRFSENSKEYEPYAFNGVHILSKRFFELPIQEGYSDIIEIYISNSKNLSIKGYDAENSTFLDIGKMKNLIL